MPTTIWRPTRLAIALLVGLTLLASACGSDDETADGGSFGPGVLDSGATIERFDADGVTVHTYTNTEAGFGNTTAAIESDNAVVLVDAHFGDEPATEFRAMAESFGKPIERLFVTHEHPDHIGGIEGVFSDVDTASSAGVVEAAAAAGTTISSVIEPGDVDGDLLYSDYHAVMSPTFDSWLTILDTLAATDGIEVVIPGHGPPGGPEVFADSIDYLATAETIFAESTDAESFNAALVEAYPDRLGANLLEFGSGRLFG